MLSTNTYDLTTSSSTIDSKSVILYLPDLVGNISKKSIFRNRFISVFILEVLLTSLCVFSDYLVFKSDKFRIFLSSITGIETRYFTAFIDNVSHLFIGILSYSIFSIPNLFSIKHLILCGLISSLIDIDHFISAKSINLTDAVSLTRRPFMHNTLSLLIVNLLIFIFFLLYKPKLSYIALIVFLSWFSHHVRDANRHGLWFGYEIRTPPIKDELYITITCLLPFISRILYDNLK